MAAQDRWLLPDGIDELLPRQAAAMERLRRASLDLLASWGYELVEPPLIEYVESLLSGIGEDLDLQTFKLIDQQTGRMMGIRADITLQAARIDVHRLKREVPTRLCYCGPILHTLSEKFAGSRNPVQLGAELYGAADLHADAEVIRAMLGILAAAGVGPVWLELGHIGLIRAFMAQAQLRTEAQAQLYAAVRRKDGSAIDAMLHSGELPGATGRLLHALLELSGGPEVIARARLELGELPAPARQALDELESLVALLDSPRQWTGLHVDLAESRGYRYHTGTVFAAYVAGQGDAIAKGGRYDSVGAVFGRARPATGFSTDLKHLVGIQAAGTARRPAILAPPETNAGLLALIDRLRAEGEVVITAMPGCDNDPRALGCDREIVGQGEQWSVRRIGT